MSAKKTTAINWVSKPNYRGDLAYTCIGCGEQYPIDEFFYT